MAKTDIEWATDVWNPTTGCDRVSPGCDHCYAMTLAKRLKGMGQAKYQRDGDPRTSGPGFGLTIHSDALGIPMRWREPRRVFVNSMSDLFHDKVPDRFIAAVFAVMALTPRHTFQVLTKRHGRMRSLLNSPDFRPAVQRAALSRVGNKAPWLVEPWWPLHNVWLGVSVEDQRWADIRIPAVRWLSCEPLLGPVTIGPYLTRDHECPRCDGLGSILVPGGGHACPDCGYDYRSARSDGVDWVVVGGESGSGARPMHPGWARQLRDQCTAVGVAYFHKQNGQYAPVTDQPRPGDLWLAPDGATAGWKPGDGHIRDGFGEYRWPGTRTVLVRRARSKHDTGRDLDGRTWDEYPQRWAVAT